MKNREAKKYYAIQHNNGVFTLTQLKEEDALVCSIYCYVNRVFINPEIKISEGVLKVKGSIHEYEYIRQSDSYKYIPYPIRWLEKGWENRIYYFDKNIVKRDLVEWGGFLGLKRTKTKDAPHLEPRKYLKKRGVIEEVTTSCFEIIEL